MLFDDKHTHFSYQQRNMCDFRVTKNNIKVGKNFEFDGLNYSSSSIEKSHWRNSTDFTKQQMLHKYTQDNSIGWLISFLFTEILMDGGMQTTMSPWILLYCAWSHRKRL